MLAAAAHSHQYDKFARLTYSFCFATIRAPRMKKHLFGVDAILARGVAALNPRSSGCPHVAGRYEQHESAKRDGVRSEAGGAQVSREQLHQAFPLGDA
jgi:hypothetical protein